MKKHLLPGLLVLLIAISTDVKCQRQTYVKQNINFDSDASQLTKNHKRTINKLFDTLLQKHVIIKVFIKGNTDNVGDSLYNKKLSQLRSKAVKDHILSKRVSSSIIHTSNFGEDMPVSSNDNETGKLKNRRVELIVIYKPKPVEVIPIVIEPKKPGICEKDTIIKLSQGSTVKINKCDYDRMKDCITISEFTNQQSLISSDLNTMTSNNTALISGGMFNINLCAKDTCLKKPITIRVPYNDSCLGDAKLTLWNMTVGNRWGNSTSKGLKLITENGKKFYEFEVFCSGGKNLDVKISNFIKYTIKINFTLKSRRTKLLEVRLAYDCPNAVITGVNKRAQKTIAVKGFCPDKEPFVYAKAVTKRGDTLEMEYIPISVLSHKDSYCHCEKATIKTGGRKAGKNEAAKFPLYRRYYLKRSNFERISRQQFVKN